MRGPTGDGGFALAALIIFLTALSIAMAAAAPAYRMQAQRELEQELIFRGQEYVRAIDKYRRAFGIFPPDIEALLDTNGVRFLRRAYTDPITGEGFRLLTVNPDGTIDGSVLFENVAADENLFRGSDPQAFGENPPANPFGAQAGGFAGATGAGAGFSPPGSESSSQGRGRGANTGFGGGLSPAGGGFGNPQGEGFSPGQTGGIGQPGGFGNNPSGFGQAINPGASSRGGGVGGGFGQQNPGFGSSVAPNNGRGGFSGGAGPGNPTSAGRGGFGSQQGGGNAPGGFGGSSPFGSQPPTTPTDGGGAGGGFAPPNFSAGGVVGVAPLNEGASLIAYNQREVYNEWEFIAIPGYGTVPLISPFASLQQGSAGAENPFGEGQVTPFGLVNRGGGERP